MDLFEYYANTLDHLVACSEIVSSLLLLFRYHIAGNSMFVKQNIMYLSLLLDTTKATTDVCFLLKVVT